jgi:hypothetical protein
MNKLNLLLLALLLFGTLAVAGESNPYNGRWYANFIDPDGTYQQGRLDVKDEGGTWQVYVRRFFYMPCERREVIITVSRATAEELEFGITNLTLRGCDDWHVKTKRVDEKTLEGELYIEGRPATGKKFTLTRTY